MEEIEHKETLAPLGVDPRAPEPILHQALKTALDDEYRAYEAYMRVIETFGAKPPFASIIEAEKRHQTALLELFECHGIVPIENRWVGQMDAPKSLQEAYAMGVEAEISNIAMYDTLLSYTQNYPDVQEVFFRLQAASYNNHLPVFQAHLEGVASKAVPNASTPMMENALPSMEKMSEQMSEWSAMAGKLASGQMSQEEMLKLLSGTNFSFIAGALLGAIGAGVVGSMSQKNEEQTEEKE
ncbi:ferritin-like domain-containing protein [Sulfurospirillum barnesii]|uniref:DUF2202 domain-containing protein n=1 Tax=Sulfurospirillum barnesii (strain ATCC 700032 / DSM 10660 / SES-3) TaxID=760154 RepID=I3XY66_SULBS|nr:hypothetical protein [Sulfurospirillum barnesii]AFL68890.1 hypothetical protein Sulba_1602 [Sulfurospirillum barnesii SES-3]